MKTCAITGHRPTRFRFKYNESYAGCKRLKKRLRGQFTLLYGQGVRRFLVGGALGVDMWSREILLELKNSRSKLFYSFTFVLLLEPVFTTEAAG